MYPDGSPEHDYFVQKLRNNAAIRAGAMGLTNSWGYTNDPAKWAWGQTIACCQSGMPVSNNTLHIGSYSTAHDNMNTAPPYFDELNANAGGDESPWMLHYYDVVVGRLSELGFTEWDAYRKAQASLSVNLVLNSKIGNPYLVGTYRMGSLYSDGTWVQNLTDVYNMWMPSVQSITGWNHELRQRRGGLLLYCSCRRGILR